MLAYLLNKIRASVRLAVAYTLYRVSTVRDDRHRYTTRVTCTESETGMQSDDGRVGHQAAAASWSLAEQSMPRDGEAGGVWDQLSIVVVVGIAVVLATVVVAVSALILHTQRRLHSARAAQPDTRHAAGGAPAAQRHSDIEQVSFYCHSML